MKDENRRTAGSRSGYNSSQPNINNKYSSESRFERVRANNAQKALEEQEEHIRAELVKDIEASNRYHDADDHYSRKGRIEQTDRTGRDERRERPERNMQSERSEKKPVRSGKYKNRNKPFGRVTYLFVALFLVLMGYLVYFNVFRAADVVNSPYNARADVMKDHVNKGSILACDGQVLAHTVTDESGNSWREYPFGSTFAHVVGYDTNGKSGLESSENYTMLTSHAFILERINNDINNKKNEGDNIVTTLDPDLQTAAWNALGNNKGAVVAIDPSTGAVKAMVSKPDFDPNSVEDNWDMLNSDEESSPLLNRATYGLYPPGSVFKILTSFEFVRESADYANYQYECNGSITEGDTTIQCFDGTVHGLVDLSSSFAYSCNSSFSNIGLNLDGAHWKETCEDLLFNDTMPGKIGSARTSFAVDETSGYATKMMTAMGQGDTLTNPFHMALVVSAIANGGTLMTPYLVDHVENYNGSTVRSTHVAAYEKLMTAEESAILTELMKGVVEYGTATELNNGDYSVAGKTGTAEYSDDKSRAHSWFVGFSNVDNPDLVVAVIMEGYDGNSSARSIPVAKAVFDAYYY